MAISAPQLLELNGRMEDAFFVRVGSVTVVHIVKRINVVPLEIETFTVAEAIAALAGPYFYNLRPRTVPVLQQDFFLVSSFATAGNVIRLYWNPKVLGADRAIKRLEVDVTANLPVGSVVSEAFLGVDPAIMDARTVANPNRLILVYNNPTRQNVYRVSNDLGALWSGETAIDDVAALNHNLCDANFNDPLGDRQDVQVLQQRG